ncbi:MAG: hypothetical protein KF747_09660 [Nitrospira sp.]|nr:hypothetical protein [Nitrospira sp.]
MAPRITSTAWQSRFTERGEKVLFTETEATKPIRQGARGSTSPLRNGLERDTVADQQATMHPALLIAERVGMPNGSREVPGEFPPWR